jgi:hypothetical protein
MSWLLYALLFALVVAVSWLDPRRIPRRSELGLALRGVGYRARRKVDRALRDGRAVEDPSLAALAAAVAQERMRRIDYRGPLLRGEKLLLAAGIAEVAVALLIGVHHLTAQYATIGGSVIAVFWVVGFRRLTPSHRHPTDRLLLAFRANQELAQSAGAGELGRVLLGVA